VVGNKFIVMINICFYTKIKMGKKMSDRDKGKELPVMCSKCNLVFDRDSDYIQHYNDKHRPEEQVKKGS